MNAVHILKRTRDALSFIGTLIISIGTAWLAAYYGLIVHAIPNVDFAKLAFLIGFVGAAGTTYLTVLVAATCASALPFLLIHVRTDSLHNLANTLLNSKVKVTTPIFWHYILLSTLTIVFLLAYLSEYANNVELAFIGLSFVIFALVILSVAIIISRLATKSNSQAIRNNAAVVYASSSGLWLLSFLYIFPLVIRLDDAQHAVVTALIVMMVLPSVFAFLVLKMSYKILPVLIIIFLFIAGLLGLFPIILQIPARLVNIGAENRSLTALTHRSAQAIIDCGVKPDPGPSATKYAPYNPKLHYTVFVYSDLGDDFIIRCRDRAIQIPKTELAQATVLFPGWEPKLSRTSTP